MSKISVFSITPQSYETAEKVKKVLMEKGFDSELICSQKFSSNADKKVPSISKEIRKSFQGGNNIVGVLPLGILVRSIDPKLKKEDPWVICLDERGKHIISVLNGHKGANRFSKLIAEGISAEPIITTSEESAMEIYVGIGFHEGVNSAEIEDAIFSYLRELAIEPECLRGLCTADFKVNEELKKVSNHLGVPIFSFNHDEINSTNYSLSKSAAHDVLKIKGVAEPCAILAAKKNKRRFELVSKKVITRDITLSVVKCYP